MWWGWSCRTSSIRIGINLRIPISRISGRSLNLGTRINNVNSIRNIPSIRISM